MSIPVLYEEFQIDFKLTVTGEGTKAGFHSIIRLTNTESDNNKPGDALPSLEVHKKLNKFRVVSATLNQTAYRTVALETVPENQKKACQFKIAVANDGYTLTFTYDNTELVRKEFGQWKYPLEFANVSVYVSDKFKPATGDAIPGTVEDLSIKTCKFVIVFR